MFLHLSSTCFIPIYFLSETLFIVYGLKTINVSRRFSLEKNTKSVQESVDKGQIGRSRKHPVHLTVNAQSRIIPFAHRSTNELHELSERIILATDKNIV